MDHNEAIQLQAAVKYVLGELSQVQREEYEEHYFDCLECAKDLHAAAAFVDNAREALGQEVLEPVTKGADTVRDGWFAWLRPIVAVPAFAALLLIIAYQNTVTIPQAKLRAQQNSGERAAALTTAGTQDTALFFTSTFPLHASNARGGKAASTSTERGGEEAAAVTEDKIQVRPDESFALRFDFTPAQASDNYVGRLMDGSGRTVLQVAVPGSNTNKEIQVVVPAGRVTPGKYSLVFIADPGAKGQVAGKELLRLGFSIEFLP